MPPKIPHLEPQDLLLAAPYLSHKQLTTHFRRYAKRPNHPEVWQSLQSRLAVIEHSLTPREYADVTTALTQRAKLPLLVDELLHFSLLKRLTEAKGYSKHDFTKLMHSLTRLSGPGSTFNRTPELRVGTHKFIQDYLSTGVVDAGVSGAIADLALSFELIADKSEVDKLLS